MVDLVSGRIISRHWTVDARLAFRKRFLHIDGRTRLPKMARTRRALSIHGQRRILRASRSHSPAISHSARKSLPLLEILLQSHDHAFFSRLASQKVRASPPTAQNAPRKHGKPYAPYPPSATRLSLKSSAHLHPEHSHVPTLRLSGERVYNTSSGSVLWLSRLFHPALLLQLIQTAPVARSQLHFGSILYLYLNSSILYLYLYFYPVNSNRLSRTF